MDNIDRKKFTDFDWESKSVGEKDINEINPLPVVFTENPKLNLERSNSFQPLVRDFFLLLSVDQEDIWRECLELLELLCFSDLSTFSLAKIATENIKDELKKFKHKIINSLLIRKKYFIDKEKIDSLQCLNFDVLIRDIDFSDIRDNLFSFEDMECNDGGEKLKTFIVELSYWTTDKKLSINTVSQLIYSAYKKKFQSLVDGLTKQEDINFFTLENLKEVMMCVQFNKEDYEALYNFLNSIFPLLYCEKSDEIKKYIVGIFGLLGYKIENEEGEGEAIFEAPDIQDFYQNAKNCKNGFLLLQFIKMLGFELKLNDNHCFVLEKIDEVDKLIADMGYMHCKEISDHFDVAFKFYPIDSLEDFKNMKKNVMLEFINEILDPEILKNKYEVLLDTKNQDRLNEVILDTEVMRNMFRRVRNIIFIKKDIEDFIGIVKKFYKYSDQPNSKIHPSVIVNLLGSFAECSLTSNDMNQILEVNGKNDVYECELGCKRDISCLVRVLGVLKQNEEIPEQLITLAVQTIDFKNIELDCFRTDLINFYHVLFLLILHSQKYSKKTKNQNEAIKDVFSSSNKLCNELLKVPNVKNYLNIGIMQKEEYVGQKLAYLFMESNIKIVFRTQQENEIDKNDVGDDLKFELEELDEIDRLIMDLSKNENLNIWFNEQCDKDTNNNYLKINSLEDFKNVKKNIILSFINESPNSEILKNKYKVLLDTGNQDRLDEVVLDDRDVTLMFQSLVLANNVLDSNDFDDFFKIIQLNCQYCSYPSAKLGPYLMFNLICCFKKYSLTKNQMSKVLEFNEEHMLDQRCDLYFAERILASLKQSENIDRKILNFIGQLTNFENINLKENYNAEKLYSITINLIESFEQNFQHLQEQEKKKNAIKKFFNIGPLKTLRYYLAQIPNFKDYLHDLEFMKKSGEHGKKLAQIFINADIVPFEGDDDIDKEEDSEKESSNSEHTDYEVNENGESYVTNEQYRKKEDNLQKTPNKIDQKLEYTFYIISLIIAAASVLIGFYLSFYAFLGLFISLVLFFIPRFLKSKFQEKQNFKLDDDNSSDIARSNIIDQNESRIKNNEVPNMNGKVTGYKNGDEAFSDSSPDSI